MNKIMRFIKDEEGLEMVEYAIIGGIISVAAIIAIGLIGTAVSTKFTAIQNAVD